MNAKLGSDGRLTLSGWLLNQLDSPSFAWRTKTLLFDKGSIGWLFLPVKGYLASKSKVWRCRWERVVERHSFPIERMYASQNPRMLDYRKLQTPPIIRKIILRKLHISYGIQ